MLDDSSFFAFFKTLMSDVLGSMSGVVSVPFGLAALYSDTAWQKVLWVILAMFSLVIAAYLVWLKEHNAFVGAKGERAIFKPSNWREKLFGLDLMPVQQAAREVHSARHSGSIPRGYVGGASLAQVQQNQEFDQNLLNTAAHYLSHTGITFYGTRPPAQVLEPIPEEILMDLRFSDGATVLRRRTPGAPPAFNNLYVVRKEMPEALTVAVQFT